VHHDLAAGLILEGGYLLGEAAAGDPRASQAGVAWPPASDADPVAQDFVRCCLENEPAGP